MLRVDVVVPVQVEGEEAVVAGYVLHRAEDVDAPKVIEDVGPGDVALVGAAVLPQGVGLVDVLLLVRAVEAQAMEEVPPVRLGRGQGHGVGQVVEMALDGVATNLQEAELGVGERPPVCLLAVVMQQLLGDRFRAAAEAPLLLEDEPLHALDMGIPLRLSVLKEKFVLRLQVRRDVVVPVVGTAVRRGHRQDRDAGWRTLTFFKIFARLNTIIH